MQPVTVSAAEYTGFELPIEAVRVIGGYEGVFVLEEVTVEFSGAEYVARDNNMRRDRLR